MIEILEQILPIILLFVLGYVLKIVRFFHKEDADLFLKFVFYLTLPALILLSVTSIDLTWSDIFLPIITITVALITFCIALIVGKLLHLDKRIFGDLLIGTMVINTTFIYPFLLVTNGEASFGKLALIMLGDSVLFGLVYYIAIIYGSKHKLQKKTILKKVLKAPPFWAILVALILNGLNISIPDVGNSFFRVVADLTVPLVMISLGIYFTFKIKHFLPVSLGIILRMGFGFLLGLLMIYLFKLDGLDRTVVIVACAAPIGFSTITLASLEEINLNKEFACSLISYSMLISFITTPILLTLFQ